jgi:hypothetical protein
MWAQHEYEICLTRNREIQLAFLPSPLPEQEGPMQPLVFQGPQIVPASYPPAFFLFPLSLPYFNFITP